MKSYKRHLLFSGSTIKQALQQLNNLGKYPILFVIDKDEKIVGSITDGDVRRGLIKGINIDDSLDLIIQENPKFIRSGDQDINKVIEYREGNFKILPVIDKEDKVVNVINFNELRSYLPVDAVIMAGGRGKRLQPLTDNTPKPLLKIGDKAIMEYNVDRLALYGIDNFWFSVKYLGEQILQHFGSGKEKNINVEYVWENEPLGTIGAVSQIENFKHNYVLVTNSDVLTNIDYEQFFLDFVKQGADLAVLTIPYHVNIPYAVLETNDGKVSSFKEKPTYTYYSNGGIYLIRREMLHFIPKNKFFNATDLMEVLITNKLKVISFPFSGYWMDVGKHEDFEKANQDIIHLKL